MRLSRDMVSAAIILAVSGFLWMKTTQFDTDPLGMTQGMPATYMPRLVLSIIILLTLLMLLQSVLSRKAEVVGNLPPWQVGATALLLGGAAFLFTTLGLPLTFFGICFLMPILWGSRKYGAILLFALAMPFVIYIVFKILLGLRFPMGLLANFGL